MDEEAGNSLIASLHNLSGLLSVTKVLLYVGWLMRWWCIIITIMVIIIKVIAIFNMIITILIMVVGLIRVHQQ